MKSNVRILGLLSLILMGCGNQAQAQVGATTPFTTYEAEAGTLAGGATAVSLTAPPTTEFTSPQLEASGHAYVALTGTGQSITWKNGTSGSFTGINIRFSIPDSTGGGGTTATLDLYVNGTFRQAVTLNSAQEWLYETSSDYNGQEQAPSAGNPHKFWDDTHILISGAAVAPGSTVTLQQDSTNTAAFYWIDCVDLEPVPAALTQPANSLSITSYGAVANNSAVDSTAAIQDCINAAQSSGQIVWVPAGTFYLNTGTGLTATGITIEGAGPWYSTIYHNIPLPATSVSGLLTPTSCIVQNICFDSDAVSRVTADGDAAGLNVKGTNWVVNNVWVEHTSSGIWADGTTGTVENSRMLDTWGDGININNGNGATGNNTGDNLTVENNFVRGTGDDGLAINSGSGTGTVQMNNCTVIHNTSVAPWWANNLGVYGGDHDIVENNLLTDSVKSRGLSVGVFGSFDGLQSGVFQGNDIVRGGSLGYGSMRPALSIGTSNQTNSITSAYVGSNTISDSMFEGIHVYQDTGNVVVANNVVTAPGTTGMIVDSDATGDGTFNANLVSNLDAGQKAYVDNSTNFNQDTTSEVVDAPVEASSYNTESGGIGTQTCSEGGLNLEGIVSGSYTVYNNINLNGVTTFAVREACWSAGSTLQIYLDSPTGTLIGTCPLPATGGTQTWATATCNLSGATGYHNVYLVNTSSHDHNLEWFAFQGNGGGTITGASYNSESGGIGTQTCSEGGLNLDGIVAGSYTAYNNLDLTGATAFTVREACWSSGTTLQIYLDSPTGTPVATCPLPATGGTQAWATATCVLSGVTGYHNVYLVNTSSHDHNIEWFAFQGCGGETEGASFNTVSGGIGTQACSEGGLNLDDIEAGSYAVYANVNLNGATGFAARVSSATAVGQSAGTISIHTGSPTGPLIGTLAVTGTGGWQTWSTQICGLSGASGNQNVYLVFSGGTGDLLNLEWFDFLSNSNEIEASSYNTIAGAIGTQTCSEGGLNLDGITPGDYVAYNSINLTGMTELAVRTACATSSGGTITVHLDSPTGTVIGTITAPDTGGLQNWATQTCALSGASGYHNVYLVFTGSGALPNLEWLDFYY